MADELHFSTVAQLAERIRTRKLSPVELVHAYLERIAALDPQLNAFITVTADLALQQARVAEQEIAKGRYRGPLHGIPFGLKDIYNTRGILTSGHSKVRSEEHTSELQSRQYLVCRLLLEKKKKQKKHLCIWCMREHNTR